MVTRVPNWVWHQHSCSCQVTSWHHILSLVITWYGIHLVMFKRYCFDAIRKGSRWCEISTKILWQHCLRLSTSLLIPTTPWIKHHMMSWQGLKMHCVPQRPPMWWLVFSIWYFSSNAMPCPQHTPTPRDIFGRLKPLNCFHWTACPSLSLTEHYVTSWHGLKLNPTTIWDQCFNIVLPCLILPSSNVIITDFPPLHWHNIRCQNWMAETAAHHKVHLWGNWMVFSILNIVQ